MKGILDIEFILSVVVFLGVVTFSIFIIAINVLPSMHRYAVSEDVKSQTYQTSELLLFSTGYPSDWNATKVNATGFSSGILYILDSKKVYNFSEMCKNDYMRSKEILGQDYRTDIVINMTYSDGTPIFDCKQKLRTRIRPEFTINRIAILNESGKLSMVKMAVGLIR